MELAFFSAPCALECVDRDRVDKFKLEFMSIYGNVGIRPSDWSTADRSVASVGRPHSRFPTASEATRIRCFQVIKTIPVAVLTSNLDISQF